MTVAYLSGLINILLFQDQIIYISADETIM